VTELPIEDAAGLAAAAHDVAERRQVVYLTDASGQRLAAIVPADVAAAGAAAVEALEDAADLRAARLAAEEPGPNVAMPRCWPILPRTRPGPAGRRELRHRVAALGA
jgi:hypothetical protein